MVEDETRGGGEKRNGRTRKEGGFPGRNNEPERYYYYVYIYIYVSLVSWGSTCLANHCFLFRGSNVAQGR